MRMLISLSLQGALRCVCPPKKTHRANCLKGTTHQQPSRHHADSSVRRTFSGIGALLDLLTLSSSSSASSSTHAPTSVFSRVLYGSNGNFMLRVLPSACRMTRWAFLSREARWALRQTSPPNQPSPNFSEYSTLDRGLIEG